VTSNFYNNVNQLVEVKDGEGNSTDIYYDSYGRQNRTKDALNNNTYSEYDVLGQLIYKSGSTYPVKYEYDSQGRKILMKIFLSKQTHSATNNIKKKIRQQGELMNIQLFLMIFVTYNFKTGAPKKALDVLWGD
jgi:YD repeat-containing protein